MNRHPWKRLLAWLVDWLLVLVWAGITAAVGIPLFLSGATAGLDTVALNVISVVILVVPVTVALAALESGRHRATIGKRTQHLVVMSTSYRSSSDAAGRRTTGPRAPGSFQQHWLPDLSRRTELR